MTTGKQNDVDDHFAADDDRLSESEHPHAAANLALTALFFR
jgi:hypothetical protein